MAANTWHDREICTARDDGGVIHRVSLLRIEHTDSDYILVLHVSTACSPRIKRVQNTRYENWKTCLPPVLFNNLAEPSFCLVGWHPEGLVTCLPCLAYKGPLAWARE